MSAVLPDILDSKILSNFFFPQSKYFMKLDHCFEIWGLQLGLWCLNNARKHMVRSHTVEKSDFLKNEHSLYVASELAEHYQMFCFRKKKNYSIWFLWSHKGIYYLFLKVNKCLYRNQRFLLFRELTLPLISKSSCWSLTIFGQ